MTLALCSPAQRCTEFFIFCSLCKHFCPVLIAFLIKVLTLKEDQCKQVSSVQNKQENPLTMCSPQACEALEVVFKYIFVTLIHSECSTYKKVAKIRPLANNKHKETGLILCKDIHMTVMCFFYTFLYSRLLSFWSTPCVAPSFSYKFLSRSCQNAGDCF